MIANVASVAWSKAKYAAIATCAACVHSFLGSRPAFQAATNRSNSISLSNNAKPSLAVGEESVSSGAPEYVPIRFQFLRILGRQKEERDPISELLRNSIGATHTSPQVQLN